MKFRLLLVASPLLVAFPLLTSAQTRHECWLKMTVSHKFSQSWSAGIDLQYRRQANYRTEDHNIARYPLGAIARTWLYRIYRRGWTAIISPAGYFVGDDILTAEGKTGTTKEFRVSAGVANTIQLHRVKNKNRFLADERFLLLNTPSHYSQLRFRLQNNFIIPLLLLKQENQISWIISQEYFIKAEKKKMRFDQERIYNAVQWTHKHVEADLGYQYVLQKNAGDFYHRNQLYIQFNFSI